jgi:hypothetical protein
VPTQRQEGQAGAGQRVAAGGDGVARCHPGLCLSGDAVAASRSTPEDREVGVRVLRALAGSGLAALIYVLLLGRWLTDAVSRPVQSLEHPRQAAAVLLLLMFVAPAVTACAIHLFSTWRLYPDVGFCERLALYIPTPTAWDFAAEHASTGFVRVLTTEGRLRRGGVVFHRLSRSEGDVSRAGLDAEWRRGVRRTGARHCRGVDSM